MKKLVILFCVILFLAVNVFAISSDLKAEYERGETIIAEISGNIVEPIGKEQIEFRRGHVAVPLEYDFRKLGDKWFLWAIAPNSENNYTLVVKDIATTLAGNVERIDFEQNFSVLGNLTDYSIKPGFVYASADFSINVQLNEDFDKTITVNFPSEREVILNPGDNKIDFSISNVNETGFRKINFGKYAVPLYLIAGDNVADGKGEITLRVNPISVVSTVLAGEIIEYPFTIVNFGDEVIDDIKIEYNRGMFNINAPERIEIKPKEAVSFNISFAFELSEEIKESGINESVYVKAGDFVLELPVKISFTINESEVETPYLEEKEVLYYCSELNGLICSGGEVCDGEEKETIDGMCCTGKCALEKKGNSKRWISWTIVIVLLIAIIFIFWKYRKTKSSGKEDFARRVKVAEEKMP